MEWKNKGKLKKNPKLQRLRMRERERSADLPTSSLKTLKPKKK